MNKPLRVLAIVPARAGSKRVPRKNVRVLQGKPLVAHSIEAARGARRVARVIVSSDDQEVLAIAAGYDSSYALARPPELATDTALAIEFVRHALGVLEGAGDAAFDAVAIVQPSSPLTTSSDIDETIAILEASGADSAVSVMEIDHAIHPAKLKLLEGDKLLPYLQDEKGRMAAHQLPKLFVRNCSVYAIRRSTIDRGEIIGDDSRGYVMPRQRSIDINDELDWEFVQFLTSRERERNSLTTESTQTPAAGETDDACGAADQSPETIGAQAQAEEIAAAVANKPIIGSRLIGATVNYGLGSILPQVINFLLLPVYTRFLAPEDVGIVDLATSFGLILVVVMRLGIPGAITRFYFDHHEGSGLQDYVTTINRFLWLSSITIGAAAFGLGAVFGHRLLPGVALGYIGLVVFMSVLSCNTDLQRRLLQAREQSRYAALLSISTALANIALAVLFVVVFRLGVNGMFLAQFLAGFAFFIQARVYLARDLNGKFQSHLIKPTLLYGAGIVLSHFLGNFGPYYVRSLLAARESLGDVGLFGIASRFTNPLMIVFTAFNTAFVPIYFAARKQESAESEKNLIAAVRNTWTFALFLFLATVCLAPPAILIMTPVRYHAAAPLVRVLAVGLMGQAIYLLLTPEIFYQKKTWMITVVTFFGVAANVGLALLLVDRYGLFGVAWSTAFGQVAAGILGGILAYTLERRSSLKWSCIARTTIAAAGVGSVLFFLGPINPFLELLRGGALVLIFVSLCWALGDPSIRQLTQLVRDRFS